ncbi:MAG TPA: acyl-CoA dehydrogenase family protein [Pseudonocardiaceae bacterium]
MIELDERLRAGRDASAAAAEDLRGRALSVDADPDDMARHFNTPVLTMVRTICTPIAYRGEDADFGGWQFDNDSCLERVIGTMELARGDAGMLLATPGPALAGIVVDVLASPAQQEVFYRAIADGRTWTFFAMTEPARGNDATAMQTRLEKDGSGGYRLYGHKRYIGGGARGGVGVVFARTGPSPLSIRAVLVRPEGLPGWQARRLDMVGLRGAYLSELDFDGVPIAEDMILGQHLSPTRRGMWGAMRTFNNMRVQVACMALGTALGMYEQVCALRPGAPGAELAGLRLEAARQLVYAAAASVDENSEQAYFPSVAKLSCTPLAIATARWAAKALGPAGLLEHPLLEKWYRDVHAFEFMEGTTNIQRLHVAHGYLKGVGHE